MTRDQTVLLAVGVLAVLCLVMCLALWTALVRARRGVIRTSDELVALRRRLDDLEHASASAAAPMPTSAPVEFVITDLGAPRPPPEPMRLEGRAFADLLLRETVVKAAALAQGVRRGLAPATRNRIRFEMKQEVRRARKQRRADLKAAQRDLHARQRAALAVDRREAS
ncbi:MAG TPA: hypothetical protein VGK78_04360 [Nocardioides sp.]|uniref:hypothetical protein n=1 Tax=Nocardioides sp. TaxID=35761 RepID=UPI002F3F1818